MSCSLTGGREFSGESRNNPLQVVELLGGNPFITTKGVANKLAIAFTSAQRAIERLECARVVERVGDAKRDREYCATALLNIPRTAGPSQAGRQVAPGADSEPKSFGCQAAERPATTS